MYDQFGFNKDDKDVQQFIANPRDIQGFATIDAGPEQLAYAQEMQAA